MVIWAGFQGPFFAKNHPKKLSAPTFRVIFCKICKKSGCHRSVVGDHFAGALESRSGHTPRWGAHPSREIPGRGRGPDRGRGPKMTEIK